VENDKDNPGKISDDELYEMLRPEALSRDAWKQVRDIADDLIRKGEKDPCRAAVLGYFKFIEIEVVGLPALH